MNNWNQGNISRSATLLILLSLAACGGGGDVKDDGNHVTVDGANITTTIDKTNSFDIAISGINDDVTIAAKNTVSTMTISGANNDVVISPNVIINNIELNGTDNTLYLPVDYFPAVSLSGTGNKVVHR